MFELMPTRESCITPLFSDQLQAVYDDFTEFVERHGLAYDYDVYSGKALPKGIFISDYRRQYDAILSRMTDRHQALVTFREKYQACQSTINQLKDELAQQSTLSQAAQEFIKRAEDHYAVLYLQNDRGASIDLEMSIRDRQQVIQLAEVKHAAITKVLQKIKIHQDLLSAIIRWLELQEKREQADQGLEIYQQQLSEFAGQFRHYCALARQAKTWGQGKQDLIRDVMKVLNAID